MQKLYHYIKQVGNYARIPKKIIPIIFSFLLAFQPLVLKAQQYPVKMVPVLLPPYSLKLSEYATSTQTKLRLQVMMTDLQEPQHPTGIKFSLESSLGAVPIATSQSFVSGMSPFTLYPGSNITLTNVDLRPLFELQNLAGLNASQYAQTLPEGIYQFCFQAYDYYTKHNLSAKTCAQAYLTQYEPPLLNLPQNAEKVQVEGDIVGSKGIVFQWMPRQVAPNTHYIFILKELWDAGRSPVAGFLSSPILWKEKTYATSLYYGPEKTRLIPGKRYAWQVQAVSGNPVVGTNPTEDNGVYKNNGLSEIFYFDYVEDCKVPTFLMAKNAGRGRVELSWTMPGQPSGLYSIQYRKRDSNTDWQTEESYQTKYILTGLENQTEYEYRIGTVCGNLQNFNPSPIEGDTSGNAYAYSAIQYFTTDSEEKESSKYQCGVMPSIDLTNKAPLQTALGTNEVFMAGDFPVTVLSAQGSNGIYSGEGYIQVPYLGDTKIKVVFNNIKLNTDKQLISGVVETTYDVNESAVSFVSEGIGELFGDKGVKDITLNYTIKEIKYDEKTKRIIIIGDAGAGNESDSGSEEDSQEVLPGGKDYTLTDAKGNVWAVDEEGNITNVGRQAKGGASTPQNTAGVNAEGKATAITAEGIRVTFKNSSDSKYAFDQPEKALTSDYKELNGKLIPFKAVENKKTEPFIASVEITDNSISADSLIFKTSKGVPIDAKKVGNDYRLTLKGLYSYATEQVQAIIKQGDKYQVAGAFNLVHISPKTIKLNLVPTLGVSISDEHQVQEIKKIYKKIAIDVDISVKEAFDITPYLVNGKLPSEDAFGDLSSYSPAQNKVIEAYKQQRGVDLSYYIFVTDRPSSNGQDGYMRLGGQFGFVYDQQARTIAHELGHGALRLEHPFKTFKNVAQGDMKNLMDYNTSNTKTNTNFIYPDWKQVNDPKFKIYAFQKQSEGELFNLDVREHLRKLRLYYKYKIHFNVYRYSRTGEIKKGVDFFNYKIKDLVLIYYKKEGTITDLSFSKSEKYSNVYNKLMYQIKIRDVGEINCLSKEDRDTLYDFITEENFKYMPQNTITIEGKKTYRYSLIYSDLERIKAILIKKNTYNSLSSNEKLLLDLPLIMWSKKWEYGSIFMYNWFMEEGDINMDEELYEFLDNWKELKETEDRFKKFIKQNKEKKIIKQVDEDKIQAYAFRLYALNNLKKYLSQIDIDTNIKLSNELNEDYLNFSRYSIKIGMFDDINTPYVASFGTFSIKYLLEGNYNAEKQEISITHIWEQVDDNFDFVDGENIISQPLGVWSRSIFNYYEKVGTYKNIDPFDDRLNISNSTFNSFRDKAKIGKDFKIKGLRKSNDMFIKTIKINKNEVIYK